MSRSLTVEFTKMHGAGNDFVVLDNRWYRFDQEELSELAAQWCPRRYGIGADGLLALDPAEEDVDYRMRYVNADGSGATMCGNGARCLARFAVRAGVGEGELEFISDAGRYRAEVPTDEEAPVRLYVPSPARHAASPELEARLPSDVEAVHFIHAGTEHLVAFVPDETTVPVAEWGRSLREDPALAPAGANVNFVAVANDALRMRTYEKGVEAETPSCGTGVLAAAAVAATTGRVSDDRIAVETRGGRLHVGTGASEPGWYLEGPVVTTFRGTFQVS